MLLLGLFLISVCMTLKHLTSWYCNSYFIRLHITYRVKLIVFKALNCDALNIFNPCSPLISRRYHYVLVTKCTNWKNIAGILKLKLKIHVIGITFLMTYVRLNWTIRGLICNICILICVEIYHDGDSEMESKTHSSSLSQWVVNVETRWGCWLQHLRYADSNDFLFNFEKRMITYDSLQKHTQIYKNAHFQGSNGPITIK